jgi:acetyl-CoA carboxylase biotin carboxyl carrier protein
MNHVIAAELVANVATVVVQQGDTVRPEDTLVILESMKMEIPVLAEVHGVVAELAVVQGEVIREGDIIAVIEQTAQLGA